MKRAYVIIAPVIASILFTGMLFAVPQQLLATAGSSDPSQQTSIDGTVDTTKIPTSITKYELLSLDAQSLRAIADSEQSISIPFAGKTYVLNLVPNQLKAENFKATMTTENGIKVEVPQEDFQTYEGTVAGEDKSEVRLTITQDWISGSVKTADQWFYVEPLQNFDSQANKLIHIAYRPADTDFVLDLSDDVAEPNDETSNVHDATYTSGSAKIYYVTHKYPTTETAQVILDCDEEFYDISPSTWQSRQMAILNDAESNYNSQIDVQFTVVEQACDTTNSDLTSTDSDTLLNQLEDRWDGDSTSRDFAFLFTGKDISRSGSSTNIGLANLHGIHNPTTLGYGLAQMVSQTGYSASSYQKEILTSHEIGHIFNAVHGEAISWCATWVFGNCVEWNYSVMYDPFQGDDMTDLFSDGTNGANFDNEERIRTEADDHL